MYYAYYIYVYIYINFYTALEKEQQRRDGEIGKHELKEMGVLNMDGIEKVKLDKS